MWPRIRPEYAPDDACDRLVRLPGEQLQCDLWVPRWAGARSRRGAAAVSGVSDGGGVFAIRLRGDDPVTDHWRLLAGMWQLLFRGLDTIPRTSLWNNESGIGQRGRLAQGVSGLCGLVGTRRIQARPYAPEATEVVERANGSCGTPFLSPPGGES